MPYVNVHIDLDECDFEDRDLIKELESRGYSCLKTGAGITVDDKQIDFERIDHLATCGQLNEARQECLQMVGRAIGRTLN